MHITKTHWLGATAAPGWFDLSRHDEGDPAPDPDPGNPEGGDPAPEPEPDDPEGGDPEPEPDEPEGEKEPLGEKGQRALDRMKAERAAAKKEAAEAKRRAAAAEKKVAEFEDREKSEIDKANAKAERLADQATKAVARAVQAEVKSLAVGQFADAGDAVDVLMRDPSRYVDADGEIDTDAIEADLTDLLERKPHWAQPEPAQPAAEPKKPKPKPDPGQGPRGAPAPTDFRKASKEEVAEELAKYGYRQRWS